MRRHSIKLILNSTQYLSIGRRWYPIHSKLGNTDGRVLLYPGARETAPDTCPTCPCKNSKNYFVHARTSRYWPNSNNTPPNPRMTPKQTQAPSTTPSRFSLTFGDPPSPSAMAHTSVLFPEPFGPTTTFKRGPKIATASE